MRYEMAGIFLASPLTLSSFPTPSLLPVTLAGPAKRRVTAGRTRVESFMMVVGDEIILLFHQFVRQLRLQPCFSVQYFCADSF